MARRWMGREMRWLLITLAVLATLVVIALSIRRGIHQRRVEAAIARFRTSPSQAAADELALLLATGIPTGGQGEQILRLVLKPTVTTRSAYPADRVPTINIECPFHLAPPHRNGRYYTEGNLKCCIRMEGRETTREPGGFYTGLAYHTCFVGCKTPRLAVGTHRGQIRIDCRLTRHEWYAPVWWRLKSLATLRRQTGGIPRELGSYEAHLEIPLEITVVEPGDAEKVVLVSDHRLEEAVRQSFTCLHQQGYPLTGDPRPVSYDGVTCLKWKEVPVALVFEPVLRLPDGREIRHPSHRITDVGRFRTRAGGSGVLYCGPFVGQFSAAVPGQYEATIVLKPDPNFAYEDPAIESMWNGTLEFPVSFVVYVKTRTR